MIAALWGRGRELGVRIGRALPACAVTLALAASACSVPHFGGGGGASEPQAWCRLDDPAFVEGERKRLRLGRDAAAQVACPAPSPVSTHPDELVLPMPCGRRMVFRKVSLTLADALDYETAAFGDPDAGDGYRKSISGPWRGAVAGSFVEGADGSGSSYYYIAKYELTAPQYATLAEGAAHKPGADIGGGGPGCKTADALSGKVEGSQVLPAVGLSWAEAMAFADRYSRWLIAYERAHGGLGAVMPNNQSRPGFVRLPTEAEWEFAARGGRESDAGGRVYATAAGDLSPDLSAIAWYRGVGDEPPAGSSVYYVGRKAPNRLMLYDMVGNAEELTYELFRPVRPDGMVAGRPGGAVARGGGAEDGPEAVGVGVRREAELYDRDGPVAGRTTGVRLVLAAPFFANSRGATGGEMQGNPALRDGLSAAWTRLEKGDGTAGAKPRAEAMVQLATLAKAPPIQSAEMTRRLGEVQGQLQQASAEVAARDQTTAEEQFLTAILTAGYAREKTRKLEAVQAQVDKLRATAAGDTDPAVRQAFARFDRAVKLDQGERQAAYDYYARTVIDLGRRPADQLSRVQAVVADRLKRGALIRLLSWAPVVERQAGEARAGPPSSAVQARWRTDLEAVASASQHSANP